MKSMGLVMVAVALSVGVSACNSGSSGSGPTATAGPTTAPVVVPTADATHVYDAVRSITTSDGNKMLVDSEGNTLYVFRDDVPSSGESKCTAKCLDNWRPLLVTFDAAGTLPNLNLNLGLFKRTDSAASDLRQVMYKGKPLYLYVGDTSPGQINGTAIDGWSVAGR